MKEGRYIALDCDEVFYITDTSKLPKTLEDITEEYLTSPDYPPSIFSEEELKRLADDDYWTSVYENSMSSKEIVDRLNTQELQISRLENRLGRQRNRTRRIRRDWEKLTDYLENECHLTWDEILKEIGE